MCQNQCAANTDNRITANADNLITINTDNCITGDRIILRSKDERSVKPSKYTLAIDSIPIHVTRKQMKSIRLRVTPLGEVCVSAPYGVKDSEIVEMVRSRKLWIESQQRAFANSPQAEAERASEEEQKAWRAVVAACVPPLVKEWEPILKVQVKQLTYRNMKSRWGSCQPSTGKVCINTRLALYPPECLEYVVVHEMCHLLVANHGSQFKELLDKVMPDWRKREEKLRFQGKFGQIIKQPKLSNESNHQMSQIQLCG